MSHWIDLTSDLCEVFGGSWGRAMMGVFCENDRNGEGSEGMRWQAGLAL